jgi:DNA-binding LytR/AlgR family response regulator
MQDYIKIFMVSQPKPVLTLLTLKHILEKLPAKQFVRIHRSYAVAVNKVRSIHNRKVQMPSTELPFGNSFAEVVRNWSA